MARQGGVAVENSFIKGLITETTALKFPPNACTDTFDCVFDETGVVTRRLGFEAEVDYAPVNSTINDTEVFTEFLWAAVGGNGAKSLVVQQKGNILSFFDVSEDSTISALPPIGTIDLDSHVPSGSPINSSDYECQYAYGNGDLIVVSEAIDPVYIAYDAGSNAVTATSITIHIRDFTGVNDGLDDTERVTESIATLKVNNPEHYYNLLNQGWGNTDALTQWDSARADMPSNADYTSLYRMDEQDSFDNTRVTAQGAGNRLSARGHFLLIPYAVDRNTAMTDAGFTGATIVPGSTLIDASSGTRITTGLSPIPDTNVGNAFNSVTSQDSSICEDSFINGTQLVIGKTYDTPFRLTQVKVYGSNNEGFFVGSNTNCVINWYGKQGVAPASNTDGTLLGTVTFADTSNESTGRTIASSDGDTFWDHTWVVVQDEGNNDNKDIRIAEIQFFTEASDETSINTTKRPNCTSFYAGRVIYAGLNDVGLNNSIYFSQIIQRREQYGRCHSQNDPTSEELADLLPDDGGVIKIPDIASVSKLHPYQSSLIVIATNGVWLINGGTSGFAANDYVVRKISSQGSRSGLSVVDYNGLPVWWGDDGIFTINYAAEYDSFQVISLTDQTIRTFVLDIPAINRTFVKGCYDPSNSLAYWLYNDSEALVSSDYYIYNKVLVMNGLSKAFYPWTIGGDGPEIRGLLYLQDAERKDQAAVKYTTTVETSPTTEDLFYSETRSTTYIDWSGVATDYSDPTMLEDYISYFITGYRLDGQANRKFQSNYVLFYLDYVAGSSAYMQSIWDFTNSNSSGRWGTLQQIFNSSLTPSRDISMSRLKVRGHGKSLQLRVQSDSGKPFSLIGWVIWETSNASI